MTTKTTIPTDIELTPVACEYVAANKIRITFKTEAGDLVSYTMKTAMMLQLVNLSVATVNGFTAQILRDLGAL